MTAQAHLICVCGHDGLSHVLSAVLHGKCMWVNCECYDFKERPGVSAPDTFPNTEKQHNHETHSSRNDEGFDVT